MAMRREVGSGPLRPGALETTGHASRPLWPESVRANGPVAVRVSGRLVSAFKRHGACGECISGMGGGTGPLVGPVVSSTASEASGISVCGVHGGGGHIVVGRSIAHGGQTLLEGFQSAASGAADAAGGNSRLVGRARTRDWLYDGLRRSFGLFGVRFVAGSFYISGCCLGRGIADRTPPTVALTFDSDCTGGARQAPNWSRPRMPCDALHFSRGAEGILSPAPSPRRAIRRRA